MAGPITWRTVNGPSLAEASRPLEAAQRSFMGAFDGLRGTLKESEAFDKELWKRQDQEATQDALGKIYQAQTVDQMNALNQSGTLDQGVAANGARIDRAAVNALRDGRVSTLQNQATQAITYKNTMLDDAQANDVRRINTLALTDPTAASAELAKNPDLRKSFEIAKNIDASAQTAVERDRAKQRFGFDISEEQRKADEEAQRKLLRPIALKEAQDKAAQDALLRPIAVKQAQDALLNGPAARAAQAASVAASTESVLTSKANRDRIVAEAEKAREVKRLGVALDGNVYAEGVYKDSNAVDLAKIMKDYSIGGKDEDAGGVRSDITQRLNKLAREGVKVVGPDGKEEILPIPLGAVKAALLASTDSWGPDNFGSSFERELKTRMQGVRPTTAPAPIGGNPRVRMPATLLAPAASAQGAENPVLNDWMAFKNITRSSAEVAALPVKKQK